MKAISTFLKLSHLSEIFIQAANRNEALSALFWEKKKTPKPSLLASPEPSVAKEEMEASFATEKKGSRELAKEEKDSEGIYEIIEYADVEEVEVVSDEQPREKKEPCCEVEETEVEETGQRSLTEKELQKICNIKSRKIMDGEFIIFCKNSVTGKHYTAVVENIGIGGLFMKLSPPTIAEGEELFLEGRIGKLFKFKERAFMHSRYQEKIVFEFIDLSFETTRFLNRLGTS